MTRARARRAAPIALGLAFVALGLVLLFGGGEDDRYAIRFELDNALGLRTGSLVTEGGVQIGDVEVELGKGDKVEVTARLNQGEGPIGRDAKLYITSVNLLGQKRLEIDKGNVEKAAPSGFAFPASRVTPSTDLDEVLAVLSPDVRTRLSVVLNEAGAAVVGRDQDIGQLIETLPSTIAKATRLVDDLAGDNRTLTELLEKSDQLVADVAKERKSLAGFIDSAGQAAGSVATRREELKTTIARAPGMLRSLRGFLGELERTTVPLGPAARDLTSVSPALLATLEQVEPTQKAIGPTLEAATDAAPSLTSLATRARPVLRRATPTLGRLAEFSSDLVPVTDTLDRSANNLIATVDNWSRAVQYRDGLSHIFRGQAGVTPQTLQSLINSVVPPTSGTRKRPPGESQSAPSTQSGGSGGGGSGPTRKLPRPKTNIPGVDKVVDDVLGSVDGLLGGLGPGAQQRPGPDQDIEPLLDFLLK